MRKTEKYLTYEPNILDECRTVAETVMTRPTPGPQVKLVQRGTGPNTLQQSLWPVTGRSCSELSHNQAALPMGIYIAPTLTDSKVTNNLHDNLKRLYCQHG